jgi:protease I
LAKKVLIVVAKENFQDHEFSVVDEKLRGAGVEVDIGSSDLGKARGSFGKEIEVDKKISDVSVEDYDGVVFIGGPGSVVYQRDENAHKLAREALSKGKVIGAICIAPTILAYAGVLKGKKASVWDDGNGTQIRIIEENGGKYTGADVEVDEKIITANGPPAADKFAAKILEKLEI